MQAEKLAAQAKKAEEDSKLQHLYAKETSQKAQEARAVANEKQAFYQRLKSRQALVPPIGQATSEETGSTKDTNTPRGQPQTPSTQGQTPKRSESVQNVPAGYKSSDAGGTGRKRDGEKKRW